MRTVSDLGWDGPANLLEAVRVAASPETRGYGAMVVISGQIFAALDATKTNTHLLDAFESPGLGPLGVLDEGELIMHRELPPSPPIIKPATLATPVDIIFIAAGCDERLLDASRTGQQRFPVLQGQGCIFSNVSRAFFHVVEFAMRASTQSLAKYPIPKLTASPIMQPTKPSTEVKRQSSMPCCENAPAAMTRMEAPIGTPSAPRNRNKANSGAPYVMT